MPHFPFAQSVAASRRIFSTSTTRLAEHQPAVAGTEPETYNRLQRGFYKVMAVCWGSLAVFIMQDRYFTRPDENGNPRIHPITRWMLYYRETEEHRLERIRELLVEARREGEVNVFHNLETKRPVKDPRYDTRTLKQGDWAYGKGAQDIHHVDVENIKWRKGYGEDEDSVEVLEKQKVVTASDAQ